MMKEYPLATIVITTFNCEKYIEETIQSALQQDYPRLEIIMVDDGSTDGTIGIAERYLPEIKIVRQSNSGGPSKPRNTGLNMAKGTYISFLDGDDLLEPSRTRLQVESLEKQPDAAMCVGDYRNFKNGELGEGHFSSCPQLTNKFKQLTKGNTLYFPKGSAADILLEENFSITVSVLYRTDLVRQQCGFSEQLRACEDYHLNFRMATHYPIIAINEFVFRRRMHDTNVSSNELSMLYHYTKSRTLLMQQESCPVRAEKLKSRARLYFRSYLKLVIRRFQYQCLSQAWHLAKALHLKTYSARPNDPTSTN